MIEFSSDVKLFKKKLDTLPSSIYLKDVQGRYIWLNKISIQQLEYKHDITDSIIGKTDMDVFPSEDAAEYIKNDKKVLEENKGLITEEVVTLPNGEELTQLSCKEPLYDCSSKLIGLLGYTVDITHRKKAEKELQSSIIEAEKAKYIMTEFISNMGHDLTTPMSDMGIMANMLLLYTDEYPELKEFVEAINASYKSCERVRKKIINATSISNLNVNPEKFSIILVLLELEKKFRKKLKEKNLKLIINSLKSLKEEFIVTDKIKFFAILKALLDNAIKFTEQGQITISVNKQDGIFHIQVTDTGIGIPSNKFDYIFEHYTKLSRSNKYGSDFKGVGAGLYLARVRASILSAKISVTSKIDKGSTFTLLIPECLQKK